MQEKLRRERITDHAQEKRHGAQKSSQACRSLDITVEWSRAQEAKFASKKERLDIHATLKHSRSLKAYLSRAVGQQGAEPQLVFGTCLCCTAHST